jgi:hypothetical protein
MVSVLLFGNMMPMMAAACQPVQLSETAQDGRAQSNRDADHSLPCDNCPAPTEMDQSCVQCIICAAMAVPQFPNAPVFAISPHAYSGQRIAKLTPTFAPPETPPPRNAHG